MPRVVVVGASAAGLMAAQESASSGFETILLETSDKTGSSPADTFIDSMSEKCGVRIPKELIERKVKGFRVIPPSGKPLVFGSPGAKVDRKAFDEYYIDKIEKNNVRSVII